MTILVWRKQRSSCRGGGEDEILSRLGFPRSISRSVKLQTGWGVFVHPLCAGGRARGSPSRLAPERGGFSSLPRTSLVQKQNIPPKSVRAPCRLISAIRGDQEVSMPGLGTEDRFLSWVMSCVSASCCLGVFQPGIGSAAEAPLLCCISLHGSSCQLGGSCGSAPKSPHQEVESACALVTPCSGAAELGLGELWGSIPAAGREMVFLERRLGGGFLALHPLGAEQQSSHEAF